LKSGTITPKLSQKHPKLFYPGRGSPDLQHSAAGLRLFYILTIKLFVLTTTFFIFEKTIEFFDVLLVVYVGCVCRRNGKMAKTIKTYKGTANGIDYTINDKYYGKKNFEFLVCDTRLFENHKSNDITINAKFFRVASERSLGRMQRECEKYANGRAVITLKKVSELVIS
jgi:hypothetical protein